MYYTFLVIDDFLEDPHTLRNRALDLSFPELEKTTYFPGNNADRAVTLQGVDEVVGNIVGERLAPAQGTSHGKFRLALEGDKGSGGIHIDDCDWSGILYLTPDEYCQGGTDFYRHKAKNIDHAPLDKAQLHALGFENYEQFWKELMHKDYLDNSKWERTMHVPMKFNRLVLFRPWLFHNAGPSFGDKPENGRLIYPLFYSAVR